MIRENLARIHERMKTASAAQNREDPTLVAVCKGQPIEKIAQALDLGIQNLGENYVQEMQRHMALLCEKSLTWHFIGHLQTNKVKDLLRTVGSKPFLLHTLDRLSLAAELNKRALANGQTISCLIQVLPSALDGHPDRSGCPENQVENFIENLKEFSSIRVRGLMVLPPPELSPALTRPFFRQLKQMAQTLVLRAKESGDSRMGFDQLSMGMTNDYVEATEEGATLIRIGTGLFGART